MRKKLMAIGLAALMGIGIAGCTSAKVTTEDGFMPLSLNISEYETNKNGYSMIVDNTTGVCYLVHETDWSYSGITPLYNRDGSLVLIDEGYKK